MRQAGSVMGVAVFGSLIAGGSSFVAGFHAALITSIIVIVGAAVAVIPAFATTRTRQR
jgi:DHA2 family methylenomycin A resistance protein-like MFS transporter